MNCVHGISVKKYCGHCAMENHPRPESRTIEEKHPDSGTALRSAIDQGSTRVNRLARIGGVWQISFDIEPGAPAINLPRRR